MHVLVKLVCLVLLALTLSYAQHNQFVCLVGLLTCIAFVSFSQDFTRMLRRVRWLLVILVIIYAFSTPGEYIVHSKFPLRPTYEGLIAALTQMLTIVAMLASLTLVLSTTPRAKLIGGLYQILFPLKWVGIKVEKFAVRTWLTLHYVESRQPVMQLKSLNWDEALNSHLTHTQSTNNTIIIEVDTFKWSDWLMVLIALLATALWMGI